eukprot:356866-Chlamydomonas_euryale.AAC.2
MQACACFSPTPLRTNMNACTHGYKQVACACKCSGEYLAVRCGAVGQSCHLVWFQHAAVRQPGAQHRRCRQNLIVAEGVPYCHAHLTHIGTCGARQVPIAYYCVKLPATPPPHTHTHGPRASLISTLLSIYIVLNTKDALRRLCRDAVPTTATEQPLAEPAAQKLCEAGRAAVQRHVVMPAQGRGRVGHGGHAAAAAAMDAAMAARVVACDAILYRKAGRVDVMAKANQGHICIGWHVVEDYIATETMPTCGSMARGAPDHALHIASCHRRHRCCLLTAPQAPLPRAGPTRRAITVMSAAAAGAPSPAAPLAAAERDDFASDSRPVILYDGVCNFCNGAVDVMLQYDPEGRFRMAALQSAAGRRLLARVGRRPDDISSIVVVEPARLDGQGRGSGNGGGSSGGRDAGRRAAGVRAYLKSDAVMRIAAGMKDPFPLVSWLGAPLPGFVRDAMYDQVRESVGCGHGCGVGVLRSMGVATCVGDGRYSWGGGLRLTGR